MKVAALIVAAGRGHRFGSEVPKQYCAFGGKTVLRYVQETFSQNPKVDLVMTVINSRDRELYDLAAEGLELLPVAFGGGTRQESVFNGLNALKMYGPDYVLIHDGARPFLSHDLISSVIDKLKSFPGVVPGIPVSDTLKRVENGRVDRTIDRTSLWRVQTPQGFWFSKILDAHMRTAHISLTDDAAVAERAGLDIAMVNGTEENIKITQSNDLKMHDLGSGTIFEYRVGQGFDVHKFKDGDHIQLCGIRIEHEYALEGHSDADVGLHALTDALLGAVSAGDIGKHFPPSDPKWAGAESSIFVSHAVKLIEAMDGQIVNVDITLICETPKITQYRSGMCANVGSLLGLENNRVSIKATTTEMLGFTGRKEGIAAQAVATVRLPVGE